MDPFASTDAFSGNTTVNNSAALSSGTINTGWTTYSASNLVDRYSKDIVDNPFNNDAASFSSCMTDANPTTAESTSLSTLSQLVDRYDKDVVDNPFSAFN